MQSLETYLTKKGWKADLEETKKDFNRLYKTSSEGLTERIQSEQGGAVLGTLFLIIGICMTYSGITDFFREDPKTSGGLLKCTIACANYALAKRNGVMP